MKIDLSTIVPLTAQPHSPGNVVPVSEVEGITVSQVAIGSSVNSWFPDMAKVDRIFEGRTLHPDVTVPVTPGSSQILNTMTRLGIWGRIVKAGAIPIMPMCSWCVGIGNAPPSNSVSVRTGNRNFKGRSGTLDDSVYLVSPSTAAATAVEGYLIDPRHFAFKHGLKYPRIRVPKPTIDDSRITPPLPQSEREKVDIAWGPNINPPEINSPFPQEPAIVAGQVIIVVGDNISTGDISPDGVETMSKRSDIPEISLDTFKNIDPKFAERALSLKRQHISLAIVGGDNYGEGSSREHAALCPRYLGVSVVFAKSFARIHRRNLIQHGIIPIYINDEVYAKMENGKKWILGDIREAITSGTNKLALAFPDSHDKFVVHHDLGEGREDEPDMILAGGFVNLILEKEDRSSI